MGLDTTHDCWHGPYSAFNRFRIKIAEKAGIPLGLMEGFWGEFREVERREEPGRRFGVPWHMLKPDPLWVLLSHSDCEGWIESADCAPLAARLREIAALFEPGTGGVEDARREDLARHPGMTPEELGHTPFSKDPSLIQRAIYDGVPEACIRFAEGLERAAAAGENVEFH